jgi:SEC-C motif domain protein
MNEPTKDSAHRSFFKPTRNATVSTLSDTATCPCRAGDATITSANMSASHAYGQCCAPWHKGLQPAPPHPERHAQTPEQLMRSRYSAYVLQLGGYLLATWYGETSPGEIDFPPTKWLGLEIKHTATTGDVGVVEFIARYRDSTGRAHRLEETSRFVREGAGDTARWFYIDGVVSEP